MRCFYCDRLEVGILPADQIPAREQNHIFNVLRGKEDTMVLLIDGKGAIAEAMIEDKTALRVMKIKQLPSPETKVHLFVAPPRKNQMDQLLKQCAEVGVCSITPVITERSVAKPDKESTHDRMEILLIEGCKQAHNPFLPKLNPLIKFTDIASKLSILDRAFFGSTSGCGIVNTNKGNADLRSSQHSGDIAWIVGPEGGFTESEEQQLTASGATPLQVGPWIMRVETAAIIGASLLGY